jgi:hypothetical protein
VRSDGARLLSFSAESCSPPVVASGGAERATTSARSSPQLGNGCLAVEKEVRPVAFHTSAGTVRGGEVGGGAVGVVLSNQSDANLCGWLPFARTLARSGFRVLLFDSVSAAGNEEAIAGARALRSRGARRIVLIGASRGARASLLAAASPTAPVDAVVSLSAERRGRTVALDILPAVERLRDPVLFIASKDDFYGSGDDAALLYRAARSRAKRLVLLAGEAHGIDLLRGTRGTQVQRVILHFTRRYGA